MMYDAYTHRVYIVICIQDILEETHVYSDFFAHEEICIRKQTQEDTLVYRHVMTRYLVSELKNKMKKSGEVMSS